MGSPLAPILANLFMGYHEEQWTANYKDSQLLYYRRKFEIIFLKIVPQKSLFDAIKENPNFPSCRGILNIYRQWLLR